MLSLTGFPLNKSGLEVLLHPHLLRQEYTQHLFAMIESRLFRC